MADIPVYLVAGFLDAGKTNFINGILEDGFARRTGLSCSAVRKARRRMRKAPWTT